MINKKMATSTSENTLPKPKRKKIDVHKLEILAKRVKRYLEEEEKRLQEEENGHHQKLRFSFSH